MSILKSPSGDMKSHTLPFISYPVPRTFRPNPPAYDDIPLDATSTKKLGFRGWIKTRSRLFWVVTTLSLLLVAGLAVSLPLFFHTRNAPSLTVQSPDASQNPNPSNNHVSHSFLIDIITAEDEETRAAVSTSGSTVNGRIERSLYKNSIRQEWCIQ
jgi:hypothetical protein